ncbi:MAG: FAD-dependent monooxygenase [Chitinophagales bacterium]|nr:FAD-dependent monooxygenase [Chitinophagales bacterium]
MQKHIAIVGAGLVGSLLACYLSKRGYKVSVFEKRPDMRLAGYIGGRSINLALSHRGWKALKKTGLDKTANAIAIPMKGRMIHQLSGSTDFIPYGTGEQAIYSISRGDLNRLMVEQADEFPHVDFYFNHRCDFIDFEKNKLRFEDTLNNRFVEVNTDIIFGADGAYSEVRYEMQKTPNFNINQQHEPYGYKELSIPPGKNGEHQLEKNALHIWPRGNFMMIALPNMDGSFTVTLFNSFKGENSFEHLTTGQEVETFFAQQFPDAVALMPNIKKDFFENPTSSLVTIRCFPWKYNHTCLIGDAAHAIVPFYGQGMNCGFEDVKELDEILDATGENWEAALDKFQHQRKPNGDAILDLALYNYIEMRDLSGREDFQLRLKIEKKIAAAFPDKFMTLYAMVTFSDFSYAEAKKRGEQQSELLDAIMQLPNIEQQWEGEAVMQMAKEWINKNR